jgi:hypothetical protein
MASSDSAIRLPSRDVVAARVRRQRHGQRLFVARLAVRRLGVGHARADRAGEAVEVDHLRRGGADHRFLAAAVGVDALAADLEVVLRVAPQEPDVLRRAGDDVLH